MEIYKTDPARIPWRDWDMEIWVGTVLCPKILRVSGRVKCGAGESIRNLIRVSLQVVLPLL